ncbi:ABC transporter permease [Pseudonocardia sp. ICBG1142]|uniref:ABC transporter permease n=1 Tax=Pseudonocardia sp. ICBG1142 TaxID=2846760 RepID=UPI001CF60C71|nr:ABC transporter permease [Pseudonocardia sp. ICBG1142]
MHLLRLYWEQRSYRTALVLGGASSLVALVQFFLMGRFLQQGNTFDGIRVYGGDIVSFLLTGSIFTGFVVIGLNAFSGYLQEEQAAGTLESVLVMPVSVFKPMIFSGGAALIGTISGSFAMVAVFGAILKVPFNIDILGSVSVLFLLVLTTSGLGLTGCGALLVTKRGDPVKWTVVTVTTLLSGVAYPVTILPEWLQLIAGFLPTTIALDGMRLALTQAATPKELLPSLAGLAAWATIALAIGLWGMHTGLRIARRRGSLGEF